MRTLSLDLRGEAASYAIPDERGARGAGFSVLIHGVGVAALLLSPLFSQSQPPDAVNMARSILLQPTLEIPAPPPAPIQVARAQNTNAPSARPASAVTLQLTPPPDTPTSIGASSDVLDTPPGLPSGVGTGTSAQTGSGGDCALGAMCGQGSLPATPSAPADLPRVGGAIREPRLAESRAPIYPDIARAAGISGVVIIEAHVRADGRVMDARVLRGVAVLDDSALASVRSRRYEPLLLNGVPTEFLVTITVAFNLKR